MAENRPVNTDVEDDSNQGTDAKDSDNDVALRLPLGMDEDKRFGTAIANERLILEMARILKSLGDFDVEIKQDELKAEAEARALKRRVSVKDYFSTCLTKVLETLDIVLNWLEQSAKNAKDEMAEKREDAQSRLQGEQTDGGKSNVDGKPKDELEKKEGVLRGLYHLTGKIGSLIPGSYEGNYPCSR
jgi:ElaB/YqjD/DUF883 family membrane-anchored ribosome-binding protein